MMMKPAVGLMTQPSQTWTQLSELDDHQIRRQLPYIAIMALLPAIAWYIGTTYIGWRVSEHSLVNTIMPESALPLMALFYIGLVGSVVITGFLIHWMAETFGAKCIPERGILMAGYAATPIFIVGLAGIAPLLWLDLLLATAAASYAVYLLYSGVPKMMGVNEDQGFLFASSILAATLVVVVAVMATTVILWDVVAMPVFSS